MSTSLTTLCRRVRDFILETSLQPLPATGCANQASPDEARLEGFFLEVFAAQFELNAPYRSLCQSARRTPKTVTASASIPAVPTAAFKQFELTCLVSEQRERAFLSSGTTLQSRSRHFHSGDTLAVYEASLERWFWQHFGNGVASRPALVSLTPRPTEAPQSSLAHMLGCLSGSSAGGVGEFLGQSHEGDWSIDWGRALDTVQRIEAQQQPVLVAGTAFNFVHWMDGCAERGIRFRLPAGSVVMETGGYKGRSRELSRSALHSGIASVFGLSEAAIVCEYGMSELSSQAYDGVPGRESEREGREFRFPPWCRVRVVDPETGLEVPVGALGTLQVLDLANVGSVMAVRTEDVARRTREGFELVGRLPKAEPRGCSLMSAA